MEKLLYSAADYESKNPSQINIQLHNHDEYEIYMFFYGDSKYVVEEKNYTLAPGDIIIIRKHEMHRVFHNTASKYRRFVLMISPEFFEKNNCREYENIFLDANTDKGNKINSKDVHSSGLYDAIMRLKKYSENYTKPDSPIVKSVIIEILYLINKITFFENADNTNRTVQNIIAYLNHNFTSEITLDTLSEKFFISKYHLCRTFKQATGITVQEYVRRKRLTLVSELKKEGKNLTEASNLAGFKNYSSFYRSYVKMYK